MVQLNLRAFCNREAQTDEDFLELVQHDIERVLFADDDFLARQSDVDSLSLQLMCQRSLLDDFLLLVDDGLDFGAHVVDELADNRTLLCGHVLHAL